MVDVLESFLIKLSFCMFNSFFCLDLEQPICVGWTQPGMVLPLLLDLAGEVRGLHSGSTSCLPEDLLKAGTMSSPSISLLPLELQALCSVKYWPQSLGRDCPCYRLKCGPSP